jgi:hypothetical protein
MTYDKIFRKRVIDYKGAGHTFKQVNEVFGVNSRRYYSWKKPIPLDTSLQRNAGENKQKRTALMLEEYLDWYLREFAEQVNVACRPWTKCLRNLVSPVKNIYLFEEPGESTGRVPEGDCRNTRRETGICE